MRSDHRVHPIDTHHHDDHKTDRQQRKTRSQLLSDRQTAETAKQATGFIHRVSSFLGGPEARYLSAAARVASVRARPATLRHLPPRISSCPYESSAGMPTFSSECGTTTARRS